MAASFATIEGGDTPKPRQAALAFAPKIHNDDLIIWIYTSPDLGCWLMAKGLGWDTFFFCPGGSYHWGEKNPSHNP